MDMIIEGGIVIDGSGAEAYKADVGIAGDRITEIGDLRGASAGLKLNADGCFVTPGFIDSHCHTDMYAADYPSAEGKIMQGVTTDICGLCGYSPAPVSSRNLDCYSIQTGKGSRSPLSFAEYLKLINGQGNATNMALFVGNTNLRIHAAGNEKRPVSGDEMSLMKELLETAMSEGAFGLSTGLTYVPSKYASTEELAELSKTLVPYGGIYNSHMRNESDKLIDSVLEVIRIAEESGCKGHVSHLKATGKANHGKAVECLKLIDDANKRGVNVTFDAYPYTGSSIALSAILPDWVLSAGFGNDFEVLRDKDNLKRISEDLQKSDWDNVLLSCGYSSVYIGDSNGHPEYEGKNLTEIAELLGLSQFEAFIRVLIDSKTKATIIYYAIDEAELIELMQNKYCVIGTDAYARHYSGPTAAGKPHPRNYGAFPRFLGHYVLGRKLMPPETAVHKITGMPAKIFNLHGRGELKPSNIADIAVWNPQAIAETGSYEEPWRRPEGIEYVILGGKLAADRSGKLHCRNGKALNMRKL